MNNGKTIREALRKAKKQVEKPNAYKYDVIYGDLGQYAAPGEVTRIQGDAYGTPITMAGVPYPLYGEDDLGYSQMMYPGMDYTFPGQYVTEIPMAQKGQQVEDNDSWLENIAEVFDPTGLSSWDDVYRAYKNTGLSGETAKEILGAIPLLGKVGKLAKAYNYLAKTPRQAAAINRFNNAMQLGAISGRGSDAFQAALGAKDDSGFTWDMRHGDVPKFGGRNIFPQIELGEHGDYAYGGDPSLPNITGHYQKGGWLDQYQKRSEVRSPIYVTNPDDPRLQAYRDSLYAHNLGEEMYQDYLMHMRDKNLPINKEAMQSYTIKSHNKLGPSTLKEGLKPIESRTDIYTRKPASLMQSVFGDDRPDYYIGPEVSATLNMPANTHWKITNETYSRWKKPVQPYILKEPGKSQIKPQLKKTYNIPKKKKTDVIERIVPRKPLLTNEPQELKQSIPVSLPKTLPLDYSKRQWDFNSPMGKTMRYYDAANKLLYSDVIGNGKVQRFYESDYEREKTPMDIPYAEWEKSFQKEEGGALDQYQRRGEVMPSETTQSFIPAGLRYKMDQLKRQDPKQKQKLAEEKKYYENIAKAKEDARKQEVADRKARIADSIEAQKESVIGNPNWREVLARQTQATGDKFRVSDEPNFFDDYINPGVWIGDMASGLGQAPYAAKESNSNLPYALAIGAPLLTGALEGIGGKSAKDFITNIISPVPFTGEMINKGLNKIGKTAKNTSKYFNKKTSTAPFKINVEPNSNISADFNKKVEDVIQKNIDRVKSDTYKKRRIANTGETEEQVNKSINKYINNIKKAKFEFPNYGPKSTAEGVYYQPGSLFGLDLGRHKINVHTVGKTEDDILEVLDHEVKHMLSPLSKNSEYKLYKNYPTLEINPTIKNKDYYLLPEEQQVRFNRLNEKIRKDLNINKENLSLEDILYWNKNYQDDLLKGPKGYSDIKKLFKAAKNPISATTLKNVLNKSWAVLPAAIAAGAYQQQEEGGSIGGDDFRRGGLYTPSKIKRKAKKYGTSKNIQSSINKLFTRNYDVFGPGGRNIYNPNVYKTGGWLDNVD